MFGLKAYSLLLVTALTAGSAGAQGCEMQSEKVQGAQDQVTIPLEPKSESPKGPMKELKVLAEGGYSEVDRPFVIVARDTTVYDALKQLVSGLPEMTRGSFRRSAVVAAFASQKTTGGYSVKITQSSDGVIHINEVGPPKGSMVTQALSSPFQVALVEMDAVSGDFSVDLGPEWTAALKRYNVESGEFKMNGGFSGRVEEFDLNGTVSTLRYGDFISVQFGLSSKTAKKPRELNTLTTGLIGKHKRISIPEMHAGTLIEPPQPYLSAEGEFANEDSELSLQFRPKPTNVADGFVGWGSLTAKTTASAKN